MSDLDIVLEEIDALKSLLSALIYKGKITGAIEALTDISENIQMAIDLTLVKYPELA